MPGRTRQTPPPPLDEHQVAELRAQVSRGESPRVALRIGAQGLPAGTRGPVVAVGDPAETAEFIVVRLGGDELPFAPGELAVPGRRRTPDAATPVLAPLPAAPQSSRSRRTPDPAKAAPMTVNDSHDGTGSRRSGRASARRAQPSLEVTLRFADGAWTVQATRGGKASVRSTSVPARQARAAVAAVANESLTALVEETVAAAREDVAGRAAALREELAAVEAALAEFGQ